MNQQAITGKQILENVNRAAGQTFENQPAFIRDTYFYSPSTAMVDMDFFGTDAKDAMWKSKEFPSNTMAYSFDSIVVRAELQFNASAQLDASYRKYFLHNSYLEIRNEGNDIAKIPLVHLVDYKFAPTTATDATAAAPVDLFYTVFPKINNSYKLPKAFVVNAGEKPDIKIVVAKSLTLAAWDANHSPIMPKAGLTDDKGFYVQVELQGIQSKLAL